MREHVSLGYAVTVHSTQGVTADTSHAVLGENTTRALLYVAMTRGRDANSAHLHERVSEADGSPAADTGATVLRRDDSGQAADLISHIAAAKDDLPATALSVAAQTPLSELPPTVVGLLRSRVGIKDDLHTQHKAASAERAQQSHQ